MKRNLLVVIIFLFLFLEGFSQTTYSFELNSGVSSKSTLPFWMTANKFGTIPNSDYALLNAAVFSEFNNPDNKFDFSYKASVSGFIADENNAIINELYGSIRYKNWILTIGNKYDEIKFEGLSSTNGNFIKSTNARALPGINFQTNGFLELPFAKKWLKAKFNFAEYLMNDKRFVDDTHLHHKSLHFKSKLNEKLDLIVGLDHYVQWGGTSTTLGKLPSGFKDYLRVISGSSGGENAQAGEQINAIGNHIGSYLVQINKKSEKTNWSIYWSHPFEDRSGRELMNYPDGLYGIFIDLKKEKSLITHILGEFTYTKHQSGSYPHYKDELGISHSASGRDNYFNNSGLYQSGWTYFGAIIGSPYFTSETEINGITKGIFIQDSRFSSFNIGLKGFIKNTPYNGLLSYTTYYGWFDNEYESKPKQLSGMFEVNLPINKLPFDVILGSAFDVGNHRTDNFGGYVKIIKNGVF